jgi:NitT/TauT family transport system substrate-binding protein
MRIASPVTRRRVIAGALGAAAIACPRLVFARNTQKVKFTLSWVPGGDTMYTYVAKGMGFWDKHGLDVDIAHGSGSVASAQAIGEGRFDFGVSTPSIAILQAAKGLPVVSLAVCAYEATIGLGVLNDGPIKTPKDLEGRKVASVVSSGDYPFFPLFCKNAGVDESKVTRIQVDPKVRDRLLPEGKVDAITGYAISAMPGYVANGVKAHFILYSDYHILNYGLALMTQPKRLTAAPQLCAAVTDGLVQGLKAMMTQPDEAMKVFFKEVPEIALAAKAREMVKVGTGISIYAAGHDVIKTNGIGYIVPKDWEAMTDLVMTYLAKPGDKRPPAAELMTNRFIGIKPTAAEFAEIQKNAAPYRAYFE